jgi:hypothetical protein
MLTMVIKERKTDFILKGAFEVLTFLSSVKIQKNKTVHKITTYLRNLGYR